MQIQAIKKINLTEFPNKLSCIVYLAGCNFRCPWCFVPQLVLNQPKQPVISKAELFDFLRQKKHELDAVVLDGGEPTMRPALPLFCRNIKKLGYLIKLNTNGSNPKMLKNLIDNKLVDLVALDIKGPKEKYAQMIGFDNCAINYLLDKIDQSINLLKQSDIDYQFTTTLVPLLSQKDILETVYWLKPAKKYILSDFKPENLLSPEYTILQPYSQKTMLKIQQAIAPLIGL